MLLLRTVLALLVSIVSADDAMIEWLRSNAGVFSDKVHFQHLDPNDDTSPNGLFAKEALVKGETIMVIPNKCLLTTLPPQGICETAQALADHRRKGDESFFKDYVNYLFNGNRRGMLPGRWSNDAKKIMQQISGGELHNPVYKQSFKDSCGSGGALEEEAFEYVVSRSWVEIMIPVYDMINHRNGHWRNVEATSAHIGEDVTVYAYRDIKAGEQMFLSYNECDDTDCEDIFYVYATQEILNDYGFVEAFPQRWIWNDIPGLEDELDPLMIEIDQVEKPDPYDPGLTRMQYEVTWHTEVRPNLDSLSFMTSHVQRLDKLEPSLMAATEALGSRHERDTIRDYYKSLKQALKLAMWSSYDEAIDELAILADGDEGHHYDTLVERTLIGDLEGAYPLTCHPKQEGAAHDYATYFEMESQYQKIQYRYGAKKDDSCLFLTGWLQTCSSFRHYHEALVHYPASFLPEIKRVAYLGGGDNMILHEILKYPSIELVLGLELDQQVVRSAFLNLGTLPYFDDPRVQWWFGDATKSLQMLPEEYFGSFDLVLVDLLSFVADALFVTDTLSIMDTAKLLVKESGGLISKNEDFPNRQLTGFARYTVSMEYCDIPQLCRQSISIGSDKIDLLNAPQYDHDIPRIYMNETLRTSGKFNHWYDFRDNLDQSSNSSKNQGNVKDPSALTASATSNGLLVVIEAEKLDGSNQDMDGVIDRLQSVLAAENIEILSVNKEVTGSAAYNFVLAFREGYIVARKFPSVDNYMALDLVLWGILEKSNSLQSSILSAVGGNENKASSFRLVMSGIEGGDQDSYLSTYRTRDESCTNPDTGIESISTAADDAIWMEMAKWIPHSTNSSFAVLCGSETDSCAAFKSLNAHRTDVVIPIYTCNALVPSDETTFFKCEAEVMNLLRSSGVTMLSGIAIDIEATQAMARILLRLITGFSARSNGLLSETNYVVMAEISSEPWRSVFIERFRTEISPYSPAKEARLSFGSNKDFSVFVSGDSEFYTNLVGFVSAVSLESNQQVSVKNVMSGHAAYVPDLDPPFFNNADFDNTRAYEQLNSQTPIGMQVLFQLVLQAPKQVLEQSEQVLWQHFNDVWHGEWTSATIFGQNDDSTYDITSESRGFKRSISRDSLRRLDFDTNTDPPPLIDIGARVLIKVVDEKNWQQGFVVSRSVDGLTYKIRLYTGTGEVVEKEITDLIPQMESTYEEELPTLSMATLRTAFYSSLALFMTFDDVSKMTQHEQSILKGGIVTAIWNGGNAVLVWNGEKRVDINLFLNHEDLEVVNEFQKSFLDKFPFMATAARDLQPRGFGGVVNFAKDKVDKAPIWWPDGEKKGPQVDDEEDDDDDEEEDDDDDDEDDLPEVE